MFKHCSVVPDGDERINTCHCCGRPTYMNSGAICENDDEISSYWYRWSEGHEGRFSLAIAWTDENDYVAVVSAECKSEGLTYRIYEVQDSPFGDMSDYGEHIGRDQLKAFQNAQHFWTLVNFVAQNEPKLCCRINEHYALQGGGKTH